MNFTVRWSICRTDKSTGDDALMFLHKVTFCRESMRWETSTKLEHRTDSARNVDFHNTPRRWAFRTSVWCVLQRSRWAIPYISQQNAGSPFLRRVSNSFWERHFNESNEE